METSVQIPGRSDRKRTQSERLQGIDAMAEAFDVMPVGGMIVSSGGIVLRANLRAASMLGRRDPDELAGQDVRDFGEPADSDRARPHWKGVLGGVVTEVDWCQRLVRTDQNPLWAHIHAHAMRTEDGSLDYLVLTLEDIDRRHYQEAEQIRLVRSLHHHFEASPEPLAFMDLEGRPTRTNTAFQELLGCSAGELAELSLAAFVHPDDQGLLAGVFERLTAGEVAVDEHLRFIGRDGDLKLTLMRSILLRDEAGRPLHVQSVVSNVTQQVRDQQRLQAALDGAQEAAAKLDQVNRSQALFVSMVGHEFRTALTSVQGFSELIRDAELGSGKIQEYAGDINHEARRLGRLIDDLLDLDRLEFGRLVIQPRVVELGSLIRSQRERTDFGNRSVDLSLEGSALVLADPDRMAQVLANLFSNAIKYSPAGSAVRVVLEARPDLVEVVISDAGPGIPEQALESVFERYRRLDGPSLASIQGSGLGLAIVRQIVNLHRGRVWAESKPGSGASFHFVLPLWGGNEDDPPASPVGIADERPLP
ncbi:MAG TPA: PAS domain-containing sensor histidine kinase [Candidatus Acidoferrales bacterium]|nr:PAS domain-containing sensor histidine kinase [Candidatus Acidoferrales bacterium]